MLDTILHTLTSFWQNLDSTRLLMVVLGGLAVTITAIEGLAISKRRNANGELYDWHAF